MRAAKHASRDALSSIRLWYLFERRWAGAWLQADAKVGRNPMSPEANDLLTLLPCRSLYEQQEAETKSSKQA